MKENYVNGNHYKMDIHSVDNASFEGCAKFPKSKGSMTKDNASGKAHGVCGRGGNYSSNLSVLGFCPNCD